jgi:aspartate oxidase
VELRRHRANRQAARACQASPRAASLIVDSARSRRESRGLHFSRDWPTTLAKALPTVLSPERVRNRNV